MVRIVAVRASPCSGIVSVALECGHFRVYTEKQVASFIVKPSVRVTWHCPECAKVPQD